MLVDFVQVEGNVPFCRVADILAVKTGNAQGLEVGAEDVGRHLRVRNGAAEQVVKGLLVSLVQVDAEGLGLADDFAGDEHVDLAGVAGGGSFRAALIQVKVAGIDAEAG